ncbi:hypothetical protein SERLA73DRAFT_178067 [Serpula lacrymans var. lacrymans S7.3]|uniref:Uncharacterized protein n=1 Tax=Serpula lacrymans var. lacrymans (strain S7.3) TaxID=936435 RepID=F8PQH8_SERL3|nr:hypothetical protein SERLA73DRAFT_178067 [Serpula lacrymans var. lacrymans S7.3]
MSVVRSFFPFSSQISYGDRDSNSKTSLLMNVSYSWGGGYSRCYHGTRHARIGYLSLSSRYRYWVCGHGEFRRIRRGDGGCEGVNDVCQ